MELRERGNVAVGWDSEFWDFECQFHSVLVRITDLGLQLETVADPVFLVVDCGEIPELDRSRTVAESTD